MTRRKRPKVQPPPPPEPSRDAHFIAPARERMDTACDSCGERFYVDAQELREAGEIEVKCPYCKRAALIQHVEYACCMTIE